MASLFLVLLHIEQVNLSIAIAFFLSRRFSPIYQSLDEVVLRLVAKPTSHSGDYLSLSDFSSYFRGKVFLLICPLTLAQHIMHQVMS